MSERGDVCDFVSIGEGARGVDLTETAVCTELLVYTARLFCDGMKDRAASSLAYSRRTFVGHGEIETRSNMVGLFRARCLFKEVG